MIVIIWNTNFTWLWKSFEKLKRRSSIGGYTEEIIIILVNIIIVIITNCNQVIGLLTRYDVTWIITNQVPVLRENSTNSLSSMIEGYHHHQHLHHRHQHLHHHHQHRHHRHHQYNRRRFVFWNHNLIMEACREYLLGIAVLLLMARVKGEWLRCFCTEAGCVQTNYMCKTNHGSCYSRMTFDQTSGQLLSTRHGCDDGGLLSPMERPDTCRSAVTDELNRESTDSETESFHEDHLPFSVRVTDDRNESKSNDWEFSWKGRKRHNVKHSKSSTSASLGTIKTENSQVSIDSGNSMEIPNEIQSETEIPNSKKSQVRASKFRHDLDTSDNKNKHGRKQDGSHDRPNEYRITVSCCNEDMCNYIKEDSVERAINKNRATGSSSSSSSDPRMAINNSNNNQQSKTREQQQQLIASLSPGHVNSDLWFKMAVCLVTVFGAAIFVVIVVSAMRMLRSDKRQFRRQQLFCDCPHHVVDAVLVAGDLGVKQQLLFPVAENRGYFKSPLTLPCSTGQQGTV